jgi:predicted transposase/invertase (TIGR01784 family)
MPHRYIDPTTDFGFKLLFGREESKEVLKGFLSDVLDLPNRIADLQYIPPEQLPESPIKRIGIYDVYCVDTAGNRFIVEMQRSWLRYFKERVLFYATFPIIQQIEKGENYDFSLLPVYCVCILDYELDDEPYSVRRIQLADVATGRVFYDGLTFVFLELPKFTLSLDEIQTPTDRWLYMLKHMPQLETIPPPLNQEPFPQAFRMAELAALGEEGRKVYRREIRLISDEKAILESHVYLGRQEGRREGRAEGRREGVIAGIELALELKFGDAGKQFASTVRQIDDLHRLQALHDALRTAQSLEELRHII